MGTDWRVEERLREKLALLSQELSETLAALDAVRADLAASEKAREEADAYAGRANARIADLGERLDATEAVLRDAEKARKEAERERDAYRHEWNVSSRQQGAETRTRYAAESRAARLREALEHLLKAFLMLHRACGTGSAEQWPEVEDARAALAAEEEGK